MILKLKESRDTILNSLINGKKIEPKPIKTNGNALKMVRFISYIPSFVDSDMNNYGPYEPEDIASLPERISNLLIEKEKAKAL